MSEVLSGVFSLNKECVNKVPITSSINIKKSSHRVEAGIIILSNDLNRMLLVRGRLSRKYGPPKGGKIENELLLNTALRECKEETGYEFVESDLLEHKSGNKFYITISKILFYVVVLKHPDNYFVFKTRDKNEILSVDWLNLSQLEREIGDVSFVNKYNSPMRHLFTRDIRTSKSKMEVILEGVNWYRTNS